MRPDNCENESDDWPPDAVTGRDTSVTAGSRCWGGCDAVRMSTVTSFCLTGTSRSGFVAWPSLDISVIFRRPLPLSLIESDRAAFELFCCGCCCECVFLFNDADLCNRAEAVCADDELPSNGVCVSARGATLFTGAVGLTAVLPADKPIWHQNIKHGDFTTTSQHISTYTERVLHKNSTDKKGTAFVWNTARLPLQLQLATTVTT